MGAIDEFEHLRALPDGSLTHAEVGILLDTIRGLRRAIGEQAEKNERLVNRVHTLERSRASWRRKAEGGGDEGNRERNANG